MAKGPAKDWLFKSSSEGGGKTKSLGTDENVNNDHRGPSQQTILNTCSAQGAVLWSRNQPFSLSFRDEMTAV